VRRILNTGLLLICVLVFSCEEQGTFANCDDCTSEEPFTATLEFTLDNTQYTRGKIYVYEGNIEDSILYATLSSSGASLSIMVSINKQYSATTTYFITDKSYIVVDSATPRVRYTESQCEEPCYYVYDRKLDLRLK
jgi:hypothetical protein